jgi:hypothetical protein
MSTTAWLFVYTAISFYCLAGSLMEHFAVDSGWSSVGEAEFRSVHIAQVAASSTCTSGRRLSSRC